MINLVSRAPHSVVAHIGDLYATHSGLLTSPYSSFRPETAVVYGARWAADNGCFLRYDPDRILSMLRRYQGVGGCLWIVVPDVVKDASETLRLYHQWRDVYRQYGYPLAFVAQNGIEQYPLEWDFDCLFIGGDDEFKYSDVVRYLVDEAKQRGKWVHNGRVNTPERILYTRTIGCDSFDGTHFTRVPADVARYLPLQVVPVNIAGTVRAAYRKSVKSQEYQQLNLF